MSDSVSLPALADLVAGEAHLRETQVSTRQVYRGHFLDVRCDEVSMPDGSRTGREYMVHPGAVMVVPILDDGRVVLERQYRYPLSRAVLEFPAGKLDAEEPGIRCGVRELREETGLSAREWSHAGTTHNAIAYCTERIEVWFARGLSLGERSLDEGELLDVFAASEDELAQWVLDGSVTDAKTLVGLLWLQQWRRGAWPLQWKSAEQWLADDAG